MAILNPFRSGGAFMADIPSERAPLAAAVLIAVLLISAAIPATARTLRVPAQFQTVASALSAAVAQDTVLISAGTYRERRLLPRAGVLILGEAADPSAVVIDGEHFGTIMLLREPGLPVVLESLTIFAGGLSSSDGGGLSCVGGGLRARHCTFASNTAWMGAGIFCNQQADVRLEDCLFQDNSAFFGAGIGCYGSMLSLVRCAFIDNSSLVQWGGAGAIQIDSNSTATIEFCTFTGNRAHSMGGALVCGSGQAELSNCLFSGNSALVGGAVDVDETATPVFRNCEFRGNSASALGGAFWFRGGRADLINCSLTLNTAGQRGGGVYLQESSHLVADNTDIRDNEAPSGGEDGWLAAGCGGLLRCCDVDLLHFGYQEGSIVLDNEGCTVATEPTTWGAVKCTYW